MGELIEKNFQLELDEIDFDVLVNANKKFNMDIAMFKIRQFMEMTCDFLENLTFSERQTVAIFIKNLITSALCSLKDDCFFRLESVCDI